MPVSTAVTVIVIAQPTVQTEHVTYRVDRVLIVNLDGQEHIVIQVGWPFACFVIKIPVFFHASFCQYIFFFPIKVYHFVLCITACRGGRYGIKCSYQCSGHCKDGATCNHVTGYCDKGCDAGWKGNFCNEGEIYFSTPPSK